MFSHVTAHGYDRGATPPAAPHFPVRIRRPDTAPAMHVYERQRPISASSGNCRRATAASRHTSAAQLCPRTSPRPCGLPKRVEASPRREHSRFISATKRVCGWSTSRWALPPAPPRPVPADAALGRAKALPTYSARADAASLPEGSIRPYNKSRTVYTSPARSAAVVPPIEDASGLINTCSDSRPGSLAASRKTTRAVATFVIEAI